MLFFFKYQPICRHETTGQHVTGSYIYVSQGGGVYIIFLGHLPKTFLCKCFNPFQPSAAFHIENSHLICSANQMIGFNMKCNAGLK